MNKRYRIMHNKSDIIQIKITLALDAFNLSEKERYQNIKRKNRKHQVTKHGRSVAKQRHNNPSLN